MSVNRMLNSPSTAYSLCIRARQPAAAGGLHCCNVAWQLLRCRQRTVTVQCQVDEQQQSESSSKQRAIEVSRMTAAARASETARTDALFSDPYAAVLSSSTAEQQQQQAVMDIIATRYIDESLLNAMAATNVNTIQSGDYRQVVLLGDGMDSRPFRLPWPQGTLLFVVAPPEVHEQAEALLETLEQPPHIPRGCLLRRVNMNLAAAASVSDPAVSDVENSSSTTNMPHPKGVANTIFTSQLARAGFRADRLSVWALQGLHNQGLSRTQLQQVLTEVTNYAAFHSLLVGEIPGPMSRKDAANLLAEAGLLGAVFEYAEEGYGRWPSEQQQSQADGTYSRSDGDEADAESAVADRWLCTAQQLRLSLEQMGIYEEWSAEFADADAGDDFIGNFS